MQNCSEKYSDMDYMVTDEVGLLTRQSSGVSKGLGLRGNYLLCQSPGLLCLSQSNITRGSQLI